MRCMLTSYVLGVGSSCPVKSEGGWFSWVLKNMVEDGVNTIHNT